MSNETILIYVLIGVAVILLLWIVRLEYKLRHFLVGSSSKNIEDSLVHITKELQSLQEFRDESEKYFTMVERRLRRTIQGVETVRFNPFKGQGFGGNQSFATTFLNERGDGVVVSSLFSRDRVSVFSKPIKNGVSEFELSEEEKQSVKKAIEIVRSK